nr:YraN family protein [Chitinasiproducens palmae]
MGVAGGCAQRAAPAIPSARPVTTARISGACAAAKLRPADAHGAAWRRSPVALGSDFESRACRYLRWRGLRVEARNVRVRGGELDLVMWDGDTLVFVEVRARRGPSHGGALASIDAVKRHRLRCAAARYLLRWRGHAPPCRFDVVAFEDGRTCWLRDAFRDE